jgi:Styrene monooxygenase A putative substrate binding domain
LPEQRRGSVSSTPGFDVTIYSDRDRASLRNDVPPTGTAVYFGKSLEYDAEIIEDLYDIGNSSGMSVRIFSGAGEARTPVLAFDSPFKYRAQAVDTRLRADDSLARFLGRGGKFQVRAVTPQDLDAIAADADLTLVATGKGGLSSLFPAGPDRTAYAEPQRHLLLATFKGLDRADRQFAYRSSDGGKHNWFNIHAEFGETFFGPYLHKDIGATRAFIGFAEPGSPWIELFKSVTDAQSARDVVVNLYATYFPEDSALIEQLRPLHEDPHSWFLGAVTPTARRAVATTANGHAVVAIGDAAISFDPIGGQGAQTAVIQAASLIRALKTTRASSHTNGCRISLTSIGTIAAKRRRKLPDCFSAIRNMQRMPNYCFRPLPLTWTLVRHSSACSPNHGRCLRFRAGRRSSSLFLIWRESRPRMSWQSSNRLDSLRVHNPLKAQPSRHRRWIKTSDTSRQDAADQAVAGRKAFPSAGLLHTRSCTGRGAEVQARACRQYRRRFLAGLQTPC